MICSCDNNWNVAKAQQVASAVVLLRALDSQWVITSGCTRCFPSGSFVTNILIKPRTVRLCGFRHPPIHHYPAAPNTPLSCLRQNELPRGVFDYGLRRKFLLRAILFKAVEILKGIVVVFRIIQAMNKQHTSYEFRFRELSLCRQ